MRQVATDSADTIVGLIPTETWPNRGTERLTADELTVMVGDKGYISFDDDGKIIFSRYLGVSDRTLLGMSDSIHLLKIDNAHKPYLKFHRDNCLMS